MVFLNGTLKSGIETVLDLVDFDEHLKDVDIDVYKRQDCLHVFIMEQKLIFN